MKFNIRMCTGLHVFLFGNNCSLRRYDKRQAISSQKKIIRQKDDKIIKNYKSTLNFVMLSSNFSNKAAKRTGRNIDNLI